MEKSQEIFKQLEELETTRDGIEKRWALANNNLGLHQLVHDLLIKQVTGPSEEVAKLQKEVAERLKSRDQEKDSFLVKWKALRKELSLLTRPAIARGVERLNMEYQPLRLEKKTVSRTSGGFSMIPRVVLETNESGVLKAQRIIREGIATVRTMEDRPISQIESFVQTKLDEIHAVDLTTHRKEVDELANEKRDFITSPLRS